MIAGIIIASIIGAIALILCIPLYGSFEVRVEERFRLRLMLSWLFGAFKRQIPSGKPESARGDGRFTRRVGRGWFKFPGEAFTDNEQKVRVARLLKAVVRSAKMESLDADFRLGLDDPVDTALIFGPAGAASVLLNLYTNHNIWLLPALEGETCQGYVYARFRWLPIRLVRPVMSLLSHKSGRRIVKRALLRR